MPLNPTKKEKKNVELFHILLCDSNECRVRQWSRRPGFNPMNDSEIGT